MHTTIRGLKALFDVGVLGDRSDEELLGRFIERREEAVFEAIIERHGPMVRGVCRRVLRDDHEADDAFQATVLVLARRASSIVPREKLGNWLYGVAYQTARNARAMRAKRRAREVRLFDMPERMVVPNHLRDDLAESLYRELSRLPEKYRIPIVLCDLEGRTHREAARQLGWPIGTVSSRLSRARAILARRLARRGPLLSVGSLAVLLAQESASAGMPTRLIGSTARAARLFAAGGPVTAGVVSAGVAALTQEMLKVMLLAKLKIVTAIVVVVCALAASGAGLAYQAQTTEPSQKVHAQISAPPKNRPADSSNLTFEDLRGCMELTIREHGSLEVTHSGSIDVRVRVESLKDFERAKPILEQVLRLEPCSIGWINRDQEVKAELTEALGKVPDALTVNHEVRMRETETKIDRILKTLENPKRDRGQ
jgi:RNA polymerase sigma factor (sigma-70 family)